VFRGDEHGEQSGSCQAGGSLQGETGTVLASLRGFPIPQDTQGAEMTTSETRAISWQGDVDAALAEAKRTNRPVLLDFTAAPQ